MEPQLMAMGHLVVLAEEPLGKTKTRGRMSLLETMVVVVQALDPLATAMGLPLWSMPLLASLGVVKKKKNQTADRRILGLFSGLFSGHKEEEEPFIEPH